MRGKQATEEYVYEVDVLRAAVDGVLRQYREDPAAAHVAEDRLLERIVRDMAWKHKDKQALEMCRLLDAKRPRGYS